jgi:hypothetical protein
MADQDRTGQRAGTGRHGQARAGSAVASRAEGETSAAQARSGRPDAAAEQHGRTVTVTVPDRAVDIAMLPVAAGRRVLTAKSGLPVYVGLGVLAVADVIGLPVAAAAGVGYAVLRRWGPLHPSPQASDGEKAQSPAGSEAKR